MFVTITKVVADVAKVVDEEDVVVSVTTTINMSTKLPLRLANLTKGRRRMVLVTKNGAAHVDGGAITVLLNIGNQRNKRMLLKTRKTILKRSQRRKTQMTMAILAVLRRIFNGAFDV